jgi:hypothetical protein
MTVRLRKKMQRLIGCVYMSAAPLLPLLLPLLPQMTLEGPQKLAFTIPLMEPLPPQYYVRMVSDNWLHVSERRRDSAPDLCAWECLRCFMLAWFLLFLPV